MTTTRNATEPERRPRRRQPTEAEEVAAITRTLRYLADQVIRLDRRYQVAPPKSSFTDAELVGPIAMSAAEFCAQSTAKIRAGEIIRRPMRVAAKLAMHELGVRLFELGGTELMKVVADRAAGRRSHSYRHDIIASVWNGVGGSWWT
jgi:hypothetical protein